MGFWIKKYISMFLMPLSIGIMLILLGLFFLHRNHIKRAKITFFLSIIWLFTFSYPPVANTLLHHLESSYSTLHTAPKNIKYIYILGGGHHSDKTLPITSQIQDKAIIRLNEAIRLYRQLHENVSLIVSGNHGFFEPVTHAQMQKKLAIALGVKENHIILAPMPKDTQEEAAAAKKIIGDAPFILVTSALHMKRAMKFFKAEGLHPIPAPTNHIANTKYLDYTVLFSSYALHKSHIAFHEYLGLLWQKIKGI